MSKNDLPLELSGVNISIMVVVEATSGEAMRPARTCDESRNRTT